MRVLVMRCVGEVRRGSREERDVDLLLLGRRGRCGVGLGARTSESVPEMMRAMVEERATMETCVAGEVVGRVERGE